MTSIANIGTFLFGTYGDDLGRNWAGDKAASQIIDKGNIDGIKFKKSHIRGIGEMLNVSEDEISKIIRENKDPKVRMQKLIQQSGHTEQTIANELQTKLNSKYGINNINDFRNLSTKQRLETNYKIAREKDMIYKLFKGEKDVFSGIKKEITNAGTGKTGLAKFGAQAGKAIGKSMPLIGAVLTLGFEIPNVFKSFRDYGTGEGLKQTGRAAFSLGGFAAGAAAGAVIGSAVPIVGNIIGGLVGGMIGAFAGKTIFGKSKVEEQSEIEALGIDKNQAKELVKQGISPKQLEAQMAQQQQPQQQQVNTFGAYPQQQQNQTNPFAAYNQQQAYAPQFQGGFPMPISGNISLGDENMLSNMNSAYNMYRFVA